MYMGAFWEDVNSIYLSVYMHIFFLIFDLLTYSSCIVMYFSGLLFMSSVIWLVEDCLILSWASPLLPAGRQALISFQPLDQSALAIANGAADFHVGRAGARHPSLGQP